MAEFKLTEEEIERLIVEARHEFHRNNQAKTLDEVWSRKAARAIMELVRQRLVAAFQ